MISSQLYFMPSNIVPYFAVDVTNQELHFSLVHFKHLSDMTSKVKIAVVHRGGQTFLMGS